MLKFTLSVFLVASAAIASSAHDYEGYKIYDITARNPLEKELLHRLDVRPEYDFFDLPRSLDAPARVMVQPDEQLKFESTLKVFGMKYTQINKNVRESIEWERSQHAKGLPCTIPESGISFTEFHRFDEINAYLDMLAKNYSSRVRVETVGKSFEGRTMKTITITNGDGRADKKVIFVDAGIHAREWIAHSGAQYIIYQLVENFEENAHLLSEYDWVILPVVNPDGYEYSHTTSRMWRKTRKPVTARCDGTDGNRNFDFHWGEVGASSLACADTYMGDTPFSEPETQIVRDIMMSLSCRAKMYLTLHAYGNYLLYPWGYTSVLPSTWKDMDEVAQAGAAAIKAATGTEYTVGSSTNVLYAAAGGSDDYAFAIAGIPISITMELPKGGTGFNPLPTQILPFVSETWIGIRAMAEVVQTKY